MVVKKLVWRKIPNGNGKYTYVSKVGPVEFYIKNKNGKWTYGSNLIDEITSEFDTLIEAKDFAQEEYEVFLQCEVMETA